MRLFANAHKALAAEVARLDGLKELHDEIKRAGSLEKLVLEADAKRAEAERKVAEVEASIATANATLAGLQKQAEQQREENVKLAKSGRAAADLANEGARVVVANAKCEADNIKNQAGADATRIVAEANASKAALDAEAAEVAAAIKAARQELATTEARRADVEAEIARLRNLFAGRA
jgi:hypothetical protein